MNTVGGEIPMKVKGKEYLLSVAVLAVVIATYAFAFYNLDMKFALMVGVFSSILGAFMIPFGFWGADFAFGVAIGHVKQTDDEKVLVPFIRNYTPLEWWNLNWFIVSIGTGMLSLGTFVIGYSLARIL